MDTQPSTMPADLPTPPFRFMDLPPELRVEIYKQLVVVGYVFFTPDYYEIQTGRCSRDYLSTPKPSLSILRVSKAIYEEAEDVYLGRNTFVLPLEWYLMTPFYFSANRFSRDHILFSRSALKKLKHVSVALSVRATIPLVMVSTDWNQGEFEQMDHAQRLVRAHQKALYFLDEDRRRLCENFECLAGLQSIEIDFTDAYCPVGCCRVLDMAWSMLSGVAQKVRILGLENTREREEMLADYESYMGVSPKVMEPSSYKDFEFLSL
jgi:hypothetical protein